MDNLKIVEEAINTSGFSDQVTIGLVFNADSFYKSDIQKYELENPKALFDADGLVYLI
jgi:hypothetical protein